MPTSAPSPRRVLALALVAELLGASPARADAPVPAPAPPAPPAEAAPAAAAPPEDPQEAERDAALVAEQPTLGAGPARGAPATPSPPSRFTASSAPEGAWSRGRQVGVALGAFGLVAAGLGGGLLVGSAANRAERDRALAGNDGRGDVCGGRDPVACDRAGDAGADADRSRELALVFLVGGGALLAGGATLFLLSPPKERGVALVPSLGGAVLRGRF